MKVLSADLVAVAAARDGFPRSDAPEVAFLGRSNVGKSSLLNRLVQRRQLARTSRTPGKTRLVHWYRVERPGRALLLVDLPGYGYAKVSKAERRRWKELVESYLQGREALRAAVLLQDLRRDLSEDETSLLEWLAERDVPAIVALTKVDKLKAMRRAQRLRSIVAAVELPRQRLVATSAETGIGIADLWRAIDALIA
ncbi:MAG: ribosome biogenesis GTP-binding protein YihA/YsxC [Myxococcales bacterium]|nr:ribosome biogenesis GTP-binding protein YihA/YsxC [Myxococcales bacterium]